MKIIIPRISKSKIKLILSLVLSLAVMFFVPGDFIILKKLGKTLFFILSVSSIYLALNLTSFLSDHKRTEEYNVVEDFYNVVEKVPSSVNKKTYSSDAASQTVKEMTKVIPWTAKNVMIGTVRNNIQLEFNLKNNCYYTPARFVTNDNLPVKSIVVYEEDDKGNLFIKRKADVVKYNLVKRKSIPVPMSRKNGDEKYWFFKVNGWEELKNPIIVKDTYRGKPLFTNTYLIENCRYSYQLVSVNSKAEYDLCINIEDILEKRVSAEYKINSRLSIVYSNDKLFIKNNSGEVLLSVSQTDYINHPKLMFEKIIKYIK